MKKYNVSNNLDICVMFKNSWQFSTQNRIIKTTFNIKGYTKDTEHKKDVDKKKDAQKFWVHVAV